MFVIYKTVTFHFNHVYTPLSFLRALLQALCSSKTLLPKNITLRHFLEIFRDVKAH